VTLIPNGGPVQTVTLWPSGQLKPSTATISNPNARVIAQNAIIGANENGFIDIQATSSTDILIDVSGYFSEAAYAPNGLAFYPMTPCRVLDTRSGTGPLGGPALIANATRTFPVQSACGIPPQAQAYFLNATVVPPGTLGYITIYPTGTQQPIASTLNDLEGWVVANGGVFPAGSNGSLNVYSLHSTHLVLDISGYFAPPGGSGGLVLNTINPCRAVNNQPLIGQVDTALSLLSNCGPGASPSAYALSVTLTPNAPLGYLTVWPSGLSRPVVSLQNALQGIVVGNGAILKAGTNSGLNAFIDVNSASISVDVTGYFTPATGGGTTIPSVINSPSPGSMLTGSTMTFNWNSGAVQSYMLLVGYSPYGSDIYLNTSLTVPTAQVAGLPTNGVTIYVTLYWWDPVINNWRAQVYSYISYLRMTAPQLVSPSAGSVVNSGATITWSTAPASQANWSICGSTAGSSTIANSPYGGSSLTITTSSPSPWLFCNSFSQPPGSDVAWVGDAFVFRTGSTPLGAVAPDPARISSPTQGTALTPGSVTFNWSPGTQAANYDFYVGSTPTGRDLADARGTISTSAQVVIPVGVARIWITLTTRFWSVGGSLTTSATYDVTNSGPFYAIPAPANLPPFP
jgi:hypothetical protein